MFCFFFSVHDEISFVIVTFELFAVQYLTIAIKVIVYIYIYIFIFMFFMFIYTYRYIFILLLYGEPDIKICTVAITASFCYVVIQDYL